MTTLLAARLAQQRAVFGERWRIETTEPGPGTPRFFIAEHSTGRKIVTTSLAELEQRLTCPGRSHRE